MGTSANNGLEAAMTYFKVAYRYLSRDTGREERKKERKKEKKKHTRTHARAIASLCINI
jgi:hypothetical protein